MHSPGAGRAESLVSGLVSLLVAWLVGWCFEPVQPHRVISEIRSWKY